MTESPSHEKESWLSAALRATWRAGAGESLRERAWHGSMAIKRARCAPPLRRSRRRRRGRRGPSGRPRVPQAAARLAPRGRREVNGKEHVRVQREHQMANRDAPVALRRSRPAAPRRGKTPRARSFGRRSARWPATRSSSRERDLVVVRRAPRCEIDADANAARCAHNRVVRAVVVEPPTASIGAWNLEIQPNRRPATIRGVSHRPPAWL